jgi:hypothetical protein
MHLYVREDVDIRERIKPNGQAIVFIKEAYVIHPWSATETCC